MNDVVEDIAKWCQTAFSLSSNFIQSKAFAELATKINKAVEKHKHLIEYGQDIRFKKGKWVKRTEQTGDLLDEFT